MSDEGAIKAVTQHLVGRLQGINGATVSSVPPDRMPVGNKVVNLFLYQIMPNAAWRNMDPPRQARPTEARHPLLALTLHYLMTASSGNSDLDAHEVLGEAMLHLHDTPMIHADELDPQPELIRVSLAPIGMDEMSKLWTMFQAPYRPSVAYEVSVLLIESRRPPRAALPVLRRGPEDRGPVAVSTAMPELHELRPPRRQLAVRLGETLTLVGRNLDAAPLTVQFHNERLALRVPGATDPPLAISVNASEIEVPILGPAQDPDAVHKWAPGFHMVSLLVQHTEVPHPWSTNALALGLAPEIILGATQVAPGGQLDLECRPRMRPEQRAVLMLGSRQISDPVVSTPMPQPDAQGHVSPGEMAKLQQPTTLTFTIPADLPPSATPQDPQAKYVVRLRVDGVDSIPIDLSKPGPLEFDPSQMISVP